VLGACLGRQDFDYVHYFVDRNDGWHCLLCDAGPMLMNRVRHHRNAFWHSNARKEFMQARSVFKSRIEMLGYGPWQQIVEGAMSPVSKNTSLRDRRAHYFRFVQTLERYEQMERLSWLELAIWKANCIAKTTAYGVVFSTCRRLTTTGFSKVALIHLCIDSKSESRAAPLPLSRLSLVASHTHSYYLIVALL
jgi:hypothetical protein